MVASKEKTRYLLTLDIEDKSILENMAKEQNRSMNNLITTVLKKHIKEETKEDV